MKKIDLLVTGVGGQGVILAGDILSEAALAAGYDVKKTDTLGMAQRGGSVVSHVRIATEVKSPLAREGDVDIILAFEKLEAARWAHFLRPGGVIIVNNQSLPPLAVSVGKERYPADAEIKDILLKRTEQVHFVDGIRRATEMGNAKTLNVFMLGCVSNFLPIESTTWQASIAGRVPEKVSRINMTAFDEGRKEIGDGHR
ncbi:indolepyruvate oxidoreductase subunit beta [Chloroflexota bacterium]